MSTNTLDWSTLPEATREEIDVFETELNRFLEGKVAEKVFLEFRLRHGVYGQRQPDTQMLRIKIPLGRVTSDQMEALADIAEEYSDSILHVTTRQDFQLHFVNILDTPNIFRRLATVGITTREACGNTVRNVTACPFAGVCSTETFDVTPYARSMAYFLLRHPDSQNFGRKFKIAFSGCAGEACGLARMHDIGAIARERKVDGKKQRGFEVYVGGGLGAVPHQAQLFDAFVPEEQMLPLAQAIARVFARLGEKKQRARARMKFLVANLGIEAFRKEVLEELGRLPEDSRRESMTRDAVAHEIGSCDEQPLRQSSQLDLSRSDLTRAFKIWYASNVRPQSQAGYSAVTVFLPLGDLTAEQMRGLAQVARRYVRDTLRTTVAQNLVLRWVSNEDLPQLHRDLEDLNLGLPFADSVADITACPGTDSCKLGIASSRGLAAVFHQDNLEVLQSTNGSNQGTEAAGPRRDLSIKISGCFNSCGQHHVANIGFFGSSKRKGSKVAPVFQVILGGTTEDNGGAYGLMVAKVAAHLAPDVVRKLTKLYDTEKTDGESFNNCMERLGKARIRDELAEFGELGEADAFFYDNRQTWQFVKEVGKGECAGEVVDQADFLLEDAERMIFDASLQFEAKRFQEAGAQALAAMQKAVDALLSSRGLLLSDNYDPVVEFRKHFFDTGGFLAGVGDYFFKAAEEGGSPITPDRSRQRLEEANLFVEEAHVVYSRMAGTSVK